MDKELEHLRLNINQLAALTDLHRQTFAARLANVPLATGSNAKLKLYSLTDILITLLSRSTASGASGDSARIVQVTARAYSKSDAKGHNTLQSQKHRNWADITLGDLLNTVAQEHGLAAKVDEALAARKLTHEDQAGESDMNLITRLAARYGAVSKVTHDTWVLMLRAAKKTTKGNDTPVITVTPAQVSRWSYRNNSDYPDSSQKGGGTHVIRYHDLTDGGKIKSITVGSGELVVHEEVTMFNLEAAQEIASGLTTNSKKKLCQMNVGLPPGDSEAWRIGSGISVKRSFGSVIREGT